MSDPTTITLTAPAAAPLTIGAGTNIKIVDLDLGWPDVRDVEANATGRDGIVDATEHFGARVITALLRAKDATFAERQALAAYLAPSRRSVIRFDDLPLGDPAMQAEVRGMNRAGRYSNPMITIDAMEITAQWKARRGVLESVDPIHSVQVLPSGAGSTPGRPYDLTFPRTYPAAPVDGAAFVHNAGGAIAYPIVNIYGPITAPVIEHTERGAALSFPGLTIDAGNYLEIDTRARTIRYNSDPNNNRRRFLDSAASRWWALDSGTQQVRLTGTSISPTTQATVQWRDAYL